MSASYCNVKPYLIKTSHETVALEIIYGKGRGEVFASVTTLCSRSTVNL